VSNLELIRLDGYEFLMQNCMQNLHSSAVGLITPPSIDKAGDRICIFGFSRGAYTARGLAGMIHKVYMLIAVTIVLD
jgi:uncharacterized protein (DUF2235 family)